LRTGSEPERMAAILRFICGQAITGVPGVWGNNKDEIQGSFTSFRMTASKGRDG
jgi:hypothetical protein